MQWKELVDKIQERNSDLREANIRYWVRQLDLGRPEDTKRKYYSPLDMEKILLAAKKGE